MPGVPGIQSYSSVAASNTALFPENMAPSMVNDSARQLQADIRAWYTDAQWVNWGDTPSRASATTFKIATDVTSRYTVNSRLKMYDATTFYGVITASSYGAPDTTVTVVTDTGSLTTSLTSVALSIISPTNLSIPTTIGRKGADIASATTTDIGAGTGDFVDVTGTTTITGLGTIASGVLRDVRFTGALTLTHNATSLILPSAANITTAANDTARFRSLGSGNWLCMEYKTANGTPVGGANITGLAALTAPDGADELPIYDTSATANKKITLINLVNGQTEDTTPDPTADYVMTYDASATNTKKVLLKNIGSWIKISTAAASNSATIDFTGLTSAHRLYMVVFDRVVPATDAVNFWMRTSTDNGSNYDVGASDYNQVSTGVSTATWTSDAKALTTKIIIQSYVASALGNTAPNALFGTVYIHNPSAANRCWVTADVSYYNSGEVFARGFPIGYRDAVADVDAIRFLMSSGNITSGNFTLYGLLA